MEQFNVSNGAAVATQDRLREHYEIEKELANRLRNAPRHERLKLYSSVYDELFLRTPDHGQMARKGKPEMVAGRVASQMYMLRPLLRPDAVFLEIGAGDCALSCAVAPLVRTVLALDVSAVITTGPRPRNVEVILSNGCDIPVPVGSVNIAYSNQLMEHLHPDDAIEQLTNIYHALAPGGVYVCVTPNRLLGPHDVSRSFDPVAMGFHLKEYTTTELAALFRRVGFQRTTPWFGIKRRAFATSLPAMQLCETVLEAFPRELRQVITQYPPFRVMLNTWLVAAK